MSTSSTDRRQHDLRAPSVPGHAPTPLEGAERRANGPGGDRRTGDRRVRARTVDFINATLDRVTPDQAFARITQADPERPFRYVVTPNVDHLVRLDRSPDLKPLYAGAWLSLCDSRVLELLGSASGVDLDATPGADLVERLFQDAISPDEPITIIGASRSVIVALGRRYGLTNVRWHNPPMGLAKNPAAVAAAAAFVAANPSRFVFFAVGAPQQELVAWACAERADCFGVGLCIGASLDFLAGATARAPLWMRGLGLEWLHRLGAEPSRMWRRYLIDGPRVFALWYEWRRDRNRLEQTRLARSSENA